MFTIKNVLYLINKKYVLIHNFYHNNNILIHNLYVKCEICKY